MSQPLESHWVAVKRILRYLKGTLNFGLKLYLAPTHKPLSLQVFCDNQSAVLLAHNPILHSRTKHMEIDLFFVREKVLAKQLSVVHIPGTDQWADILTKPVSTAKFLLMHSKLNVAEAPP